MSLNTNESTDDLRDLVINLNARLSAFEDYFKELISLSKPQPEHLDVRGAAEILKLQPGTIYQKVFKGEIPFRKRGQKLFFVRKELLQWIDSGRIDKLK
ncbi:MAG TPA: helix-turn-helix domain-containing protein [Ohtaekwangia sp.]|nr:helix-turn-helix domain-containing protein [Ohtaekwangia sp.]